MNTPLHKALKIIIQRKDLSPEQMAQAMQEIMEGKANASQIAGFLIGIETKGPNIEELTAATQVMRSLAHKVVIPSCDLIDIVGTGGDEAHTFNISTTSAFIVAAAGGIVAKHGNRSVSSSSGSADVLEFAGIQLNLTDSQAVECIKKTGMIFLYAPEYHKALKFAAHIRKELGVRTFFNLLGPLTNPANASILIVGVYSKKWLRPVAEVLLRLDCQRALVMHSDDGLDEISLRAPTRVVELQHQLITEYVISPQQFGIEQQSIDSLRVTNPAESFAIMKSVLQNNSGPARDIVLLNAGIAIYIAGLAPTMHEGVEKAKDMLASGKALEKLNQLISFTQQMQQT